MKAASYRGDGSTLKPYPTLTATWLACEPPDPGSKVSQLLELAVGGDIIRQVTIGTSEDGTAQIGFLPSPTHNFEVE